MDYSKYKNNLPVVTKQQFTTMYAYSKGSLMDTIEGAILTPTQWNTKVASARSVGWICEEVVNDAAYKEARKACDAHTRQLEQNFLDDLLNEYGMPKDEFSEKLLQMAWQDCRSDGFSEVEDRFSELSDLYDLAKKVFSK